MEGLRLDVGGETLALDRILEKENQTGGGSYLLEDLDQRDVVAADGDEVLVVGNRQGLRVRDPGKRQERRDKETQLVHRRTSSQPSTGAPRLSKSAGSSALVIDRERLSGGILPTEPFGPEKSFFPQTGGTVGIGQNLGEGGGDRILVFRFYPGDGVPPHLGKRPSPGSHHRCPACHGLQNRHSEAFHQRGKSEDAGHAVERGQVFVRYRTQQSLAGFRRSPNLFVDLFEAEVLLSHQQQLKAEVQPLADPAEGTNEPHQVLSRLDPPHVQNVRGRESVALLDSEQIVLVLVPGERVKPQAIHRIGYGNDPFFGETIAFENGEAGGLPGGQASPPPPGPAAET